jgi:hypothetical protein
MNERVQRMREDLQAIHEPGTRPAEVLGAVDDVDAPRTHGRDLLPVMVISQKLDVAHRALDIESAARNHDYLGRRFHDGFPRERLGALPFPAEHLDAASQAHQLGIPVPARERRDEPFE